MPKKFHLDTVSRFKNIVHTPVAATCLHIVYFFSSAFLSTFPQTLTSIFLVLIVPATEAVVLVAVMVVVVVAVAVVVVVVVSIVACK